MGEVVIISVMKALLNSESRYNKQRSLNRMNFSVCNNFPYKS